MFFRLVVDGVRKNILIKAPNSVIASDVASRLLCGDFENEYLIEQIEESEIDFEVSKTCEIWGNVRGVI